jgi:MFS family permease
VHHAAEAATALYWNRLSDHVGRKPVLLTCLAGTIASILSFGLSRSFWALVIRYDNPTSGADSLAVDDVPLTRNLFFIASRGMHGALKGNIGIVTSVIAELTNETNIARGFSLLPMTWAFGYVIG